MFLAHDNFSCSIVYMSGGHIKALVDFHINEVLGSSSRIDLAVI